LGVENAAKFGMVLLTGEQVESGFGLLGESLRPVITRSDFKVQAVEVSALVLVFDAKVRDRNLVVYNFEVVFVCDSDSFIGQFLIRIDLRQLPVELLFEFVVKDDPADLAAHIINLPGNFVIKAVEIGVVTGFLGFDEAVIDRLSIGNEIVTRKKLVSLFRQSKDRLRVGLVPFDAALLDESLVTEMLNVVLHSRLVTSITQPGEVIGWNDTKLA